MSKTIIFIKLILITFCLLGLSISESLGQSLHTRDQHLPCVEKHFNVYIHLSVDSTSRRPYYNKPAVDSLMARVSKFFEPICMSFSACEVNVIDNYTFHDLVDEDRIRELAVLWAKPRRLNVFILGDIPFEHCGLSTIYGIDQEDGGYIFLETEGCADTPEGQLAHHLGHFFGLQDTYHGDDPEVVDDPQCAVRSDSICDTPSDPFGLYSESQMIYQDIAADEVVMGDFVKACEFVHEKLDPNGRFYQPQVGNIMSAYPCRCGFTNGQFEKMVNNYNNSNHKPY